MTRDPTTDPASFDAPLEGSDAPPSYVLDGLPWGEVGEVLDADPRLLLSVGAMEQHGLHLPVGTNCQIAARLVEDLSARNRILRAPPFPYGVIASGGSGFSGTAGLRRKTLHRALNELVAGWERNGVEEFILVTAHRHEPHVDALLTALTSRATLTVVNLHAIDVGDLLRGPTAPRHGGEIETSLMLHLFPERVRRDEIRDRELDETALRKYVRGRLPTPPAESGGAVGHPELASAETGRRLYERYLRVVEERVLGVPPADSSGTEDGEGEEEG